MRLDLYRHLWGLDLPPEQAFTLVASQGYHGVLWLAEPPASLLLRTPTDFHRAARDNDLAYSPIIMTEGDTVEEHIESFRRQYDAALYFDPTIINCNGGADRWPLAQAMQFYESVLSIEQAGGAAVAHETHRMRPLFNPWATAMLVDRLPDIKLCADYSHWVVVCGRLLEDMDDLLARCAPRVRQIHTRVGYADGPQVPDPAAPEYATHLDTHAAWWDHIITTQREAGLERLCLVPEFGPPTYLHTLPYTNTPVSDLNRVVTWMSNWLRQRYPID